MARHSAENWSRTASNGALVLALMIAGLMGSADPAAAQMRGGWSDGSGRGSWQRPTRAPRGDGGPVWGGMRPYPPRPGRIPPWIGPRPLYSEEILIRRPRHPPPPEMAEMPASRSAARSKAPKKASARDVERRPAQTRPAPTRTPRVVRAPEQHASGEVVVELQRNAAASAVREIAREYGLVALSAQAVPLLDTTLHRFRIRNGRPVEAVLRSLAGDVRVASAQPNFIFRLQDQASGGAMAGMQYARAKLRLPEAHEITRGDGVAVAVIDSGIDARHPELAGALTGSLVARSGDPKPDAHGTAIAGIIAARAKLGGAAPAARLLAIEAFAADRRTGEARGVSTDIVKAIALAAEAQVRLVNLSFAGPSDPLVGRAIAAANTRGTIFVAAAGNGGPKAPPAYPAANPNVIAVTATDAKDALFTSANRGTYVELAAPGVDVLVPAPGSGYKLSSGTSMAAAHVTGILALVLQKKPDLTLAEARRLLAESARDLGPAGHDPDFGSGLVDARGAVERALAGPGTSPQLAATSPASP